MLVRDRTLPKTEYKGRPTQAADEMCPCRPCYNAHDCGWTDYRGHRVVHMECATRYNHGCPSPMPEPEHIFSPRGRMCKRCGASHRNVSRKRK